MALPGGRKAGTVEEAKDLFLQQLQQGLTIRAAIRAVDRNITTYERWRREDPAFVAEVARVKNMNTMTKDVKGKEIPFPQFSEKYLGARVFPHMQNVVDMIEGAEPGWLHPSMTYNKGESDLIIANMPPEHAKTTSVTINYVTYRIAMNPNIRILVVSKTQSMAKKMLFAIKTRLTHPRYAELIRQYGPVGGFDKDSEAWNQDMIYVSGNIRDSGEKDPTVQALGIRGQIYGARADLIILDDAIDSLNAHDYDKQIDWIQSEVVSRISASGALLVVGTRLQSKDLYSELKDPDRYPDDESPWTYLAMPAVLEAEEEPEDWVTLWPLSNQAEIGAKGADTEPNGDNLYVKWNGPRLSKKRKRMTPRVWSMVYQQQQVADESIFSMEALRSSINGNRLTGAIPKGMVNCRPQGMDGLIIIAGLDPASSGHTAAVVIGLDPTTNKRYVLDVSNKAGMSPEEMRNLIKDWTSRYNVAEWRIEKNGFQGFLVHDRELNEYCAARGTVIKPHFTGTNKHDSDFGVASMTTLWAGYQDGHQMIELPSTAQSEAAKQLVEQLVSWSPAAPKGQKTDIVMALWFCELGCRDRVTLYSNMGSSHAKNSFLTPWDRSNQTTVNLLEAEADRRFRPML
jgi:hypothetical protein